MSHLKKKLKSDLDWDKSELNRVSDFLKFLSPKKLLENYWKPIKTWRCFDLHFQNLLPGFLISNLITVQTYWNSNSRTKTANTIFFPYRTLKISFVYTNLLYLWMCTFLCEFFGAFFATVRGILSTKATLFINERFMQNEIVYCYIFWFWNQKIKNPNR